uniref:Plasmolipin n=1 Tax=Scophthalmus maximus TaxID=52904 RepID=A0A8D3D4S0_SCOMX
MADFPSKVATETSSPNSQSAQQGGNSLRGLAANLTSLADVSFIRSIPALLMVAEILLGLLHWALIASAPYTLVPAYGWVMFVAVTLWILTTILFFMILSDEMCLMLSPPLPLLCFASCSHVSPSFCLCVCGQFFGAVVTLAYGASAFFAYLDWKGDGGNAATSTVPV